MTTQTRPAVTPEVDAWCKKHLAKPGGHGPLPKPALAVIASVFGQPPPKAQSA